MRHAFIDNKIANDPAKISAVVKYVIVRFSCIVLTLSFVLLVINLGNFISSKVNQDLNCFR